MQHPRLGVRWVATHLTYPALCRIDSPTRMAFAARVQPSISALACPAFAPISHPLFLPQRLSHSFTIPRLPLRFSFLLRRWVQDRRGDCRGGGRAEGHRGGGRGRGAPPQPPIPPISPLLRSNHDCLHARTRVHSRALARTRALATMRAPPTPTFLASWAVVAQAHGLFSRVAYVAVRAAAAPSPAPRPISRGSLA